MTLLFRHLRAKPLLHARPGRWHCSWPRTDGAWSRSSAGVDAVKFFHEKNKLGKKKKKTKEREKTENKGSDEQKKNSFEENRVNEPPLPADAGGGATWGLDGRWCRRQAQQGTQRPLKGQERRQCAALVLRSKGRRAHSRRLVGENKKKKTKKKKEKKGKKEKGEKDKSKFISKGRITPKNEEKRKR